MRKWIVLALLALAACNDKQAPPAPDRSSAAPGSTYDLSQALIGVPANATVTWTMQEVSGCGSVDQQGYYTAPPCQVPYVGYPVTCHAVASFSQRQQVVPVTIDETLLDVRIACAIPSGMSVCLDPTQPIAVTPDGQIQWYAKLTFSCHSEWSPALPPEACQNDFCQ